MQILFETPVFTSDGQEIGRVGEVVLDPRTRKVTDLIVQEGLLFENDQLLPASLILRADENEVVLRVTAAEIDEVALDYRPEHFVDARTPADAEPNAAAQRYWTRPPGMRMSLVPPGIGSVELPPDLNIPAGDVMLLHGSPVRDRDGEDLGTVEEIMTDSDERITHIVIERGLVFPVAKCVPIEMVETIDDNQVRLCVERAVVDQLPDRE